MTRNLERQFLPAVWLIGVAALFGGSACSQPSVIEEAAADEAQHSLNVATAAVHRLQDALIAATDHPDVRTRFEFLSDEIAATHDLRFIGELTVRRQWREFTDAQRSEFSDRFAALSVMSYAARFGAVDADSFETHGVETIAGGRVQVATSIARADGSTVGLDYVLQDSGQGWRIVNVVADGVSDLALKRAEYRAVLEERGFEGLLAELEEQTENLAESAAQ